MGEPKYKYGQQEQVTVRNHNRCTALEWSVLKYCGGGGVCVCVCVCVCGCLNRFYGIQPRPQLLLWLNTYCYLFVPREGVLTHQWIIKGNKQITDKHYDATKMRKRQKQHVATDTWRSLGCRTTPLEHWSKRNQAVEPRWARQQTKNSGPNQLK